MAFWGIEVKPGKPFSYSVDKSCGRLRISQATLGIGTSDTKSLVQCNVGKKRPVLLCSLLPDKAESLHLELEFDEDEEVIFSVIGPRSVFLTGYYMGNVRRSAVGIDDSESFGEDIGDTETERSDAFVDEDYEDSFIDDCDLGASPPSPSPNGEVACKGKTKKEKPDKTKTRKRLKKKLELSESENDFTSQQKTTTDNACEQIDDSDEDDQMPISSMYGSAKNGPEGTKRKRNQVVDCSSDDNQSEEIKDKKKEKKKKKRKTTKENGELEKDETDSQMKTRETKTDLNPITRSDGLVIEELKIGEQDGKVASSGRKVSIHYTGRLKEGGDVFDSTAGKDPLKFRLGKGLALEALDLGIEGMRIGGKRRLIIPPTLGFGSEGSERVPPNSWLIMDVELLRVR